MLLLGMPLPSSLQLSIHRYCSLTYNKSKSIMWKANRDHWAK